MTFFKLLIDHDWIGPVEVEVKTGQGLHIVFNQFHGSLVNGRNY